MDNPTSLDLHQMMKDLGQHAKDAVAKNPVLSNYLLPTETSPAPAAPKPQEK